MTAVPPTAGHPDRAEPFPPGHGSTEAGAVTRDLMAIPRDGADDRGLAESICRACVAALDVDGAALSLLTASPAQQTLWATDATALLLEDLQFGLNEGACMEAAATGNPVLVPDLDDSDATARWPLFAAAVVERTGARALFVLPLQWGMFNLGVLDLYRLTAGPLVAAQLQDLFAAVDAATLMMLGLRTDPGRAEWLSPVDGGRAEVHQATGMVLAQLGISAQDALARLRAHAFVEQRLLAEVAHDVVTRRLCFTEETGQDVVDVEKERT